MIDTIANILIVIMGMATIWFLYHKQKWMRWGYIVGLLSEPFWFLTAYINGQYGIMLLAIMYSYCYAMGIYNYWIKKENWPPDVNRFTKKKEYPLGTRYKNYVYGLKTSTGFIIISEKDKEKTNG